MPRVSKEVESRFEHLEAAVMKMTEGIATVAESNRWMQRAVFGLYGVVGSLTIACIGWALRK